MTTETEAILHMAHKNAHVVELSDDKRKFLIVPDGYKEREISDPHGLKLTSPRYISQHVSMQTTDSLAEYVKRFKYDDTVLFADIGTSVIAAQIDYHRPPDAHLDDEQASNLAHRATLQLLYSTEWQLWNSISGKLHGQLEFARFIEENAADVRAPTGAELLEFVRDMHAHRKVNWIKAVRTAGGTERFEFNEESNAVTRKGNVEIPNEFILGLPVYFGEPDVELHAFLRWQLDDTGLKIGIQLHRSEHVRQAVFKQIVLRAADATGCMAIFGKI